MFSKLCSHSPASKCATVGKVSQYFPKTPPVSPPLYNVFGGGGWSGEREGGALQGPGTQRQAEGDLELRQQFPATANIIFPSQALTKVTYF